MSFTPCWRCLVFVRKALQQSNHQQHVERDEIAICKTLVTLHNLCTKLMLVMPLTRQGTNTRHRRLLLFICKYFYVESGRPAKAKSPGGNYIKVLRMSFIPCCYCLVFVQEPLQQSDLQQQIRE